MCSIHENGMPPGQRPEEKIKLTAALAGEMDDACGALSFLRRGEAVTAAVLRKKKREKRGQVSRQSRSALATLHVT
jgi:hypothetical protein